MRRDSSATATAIFAAPGIVGVVSLVGLVAALLGDGLYDAVSWLGLLIPLAVVAWALLRRRS
jgi:hypothetical protein